MIRLFTLTISRLTLKTSLISKASGMGQGAPPYNTYFRVVNLMLCLRASVIMLWNRDGTAKNAEALKAKE
jgi:hypothetical protein